MTQRMPCPPAPGPLEEYACQFDHLFANVAQRRGFRTYMEGLLLPRDRNKTLTALVGAEPVVGAQAAPVQQLQFFLSESTWDAEAVNSRRLELLLVDDATAPHQGGVLVIDDTGDRKDGNKTDHVARQYLGSVGKIDNGIVAVTSLWADERLYYPLHLQPYTPAGRLAMGKSDPAFRTKPQIAAGLVEEALKAGLSFRAVVADCVYGENVTFEEALWRSRQAYVLGLKPSKGVWAPADAAHTPEQAGRQLRWDGPEAPGDWTRLVRRFRDGHEETWWAADLVFGHYGPDRPVRAVVATTDPSTLPAMSTWYLTTNLPGPGSPRAASSPHPAADLAEIVRLYGLRNWVEQSYKQVKNELGWADFMVRTDRAIRRHWQLVCCAFSFCWQAWFKEPETAMTPAQENKPASPSEVEARQTEAIAPTEDPEAGRGENRRRQQNRKDSRPGRKGDLLASNPATSAKLAGALELPLALVAGMVELAPAT
jgi:hypothetical protein